jgi:hypothetical protein
MKTFTQIENFHLTLQTKLPIEILKMLIFNISFVILLVKSAQIPRPLNFNLTSQTELSTKILKIVIFNISSVIMSI